MNAITVDNECFYSDHIISRKPEFLNPMEYRRAICFALPSEFKCAKFIKNDKNKEEQPLTPFHYKTKDYILRPRSQSLGEFYD